MTKLTNIQTTLLNAAAARPDGSLLPTPYGLTASADQVRKAIEAVLKRALVREATAPSPETVWREDGGQRFAVMITDAGFAALGVERATAIPLALAPSTLPPALPDAGRNTKAALVLSLLKRDEGATLPELVTATGWLPHTTRASLTGLRKKGYTIMKSRRDEATCYSIVSVA